MKQKIVVKVTMNGDKSRSKAKKIAVSLSGVESFSLKGDQIEVTGDEVDPVQLTCMLRKNVGYAEILSVAAVGEKKEEKKEQPKKEDPKAPVWPYYPPYYVYDVPYGYGGQYSDNNGCSIM